MIKTIVNRFSRGIITKIHNWLLAFFLATLPFLANADFTNTPVSGGSSGCPAGQLCNPIGTSSLSELVLKVTDAAMKIGIPIATFFIIWSGLKFVMAKGSDTEITAAKKMFWYTIIGTAILLAASLLAGTLGTVVRQVFS